MTKVKLQIALMCKWCDNIIDISIVEKGTAGYGIRSIMLCARCGNDRYWKVSNKEIKDEEDKETYKTRWEIWRKKVKDYYKKMAENDDR